MFRKKRKKKETNSLVIASYNILSGGEDRLGYISNVIRKINPDICGILEAVGWQKRKLYFKKFTNNLGYKFFTIATGNSKYNIAFFSKESIEVKVIKKRIRHVILQAGITCGPFKGLSIFFVHFSPVSEAERLLETEELFKHVSKLNSSIILGDINSLSASDPYNRKKLLDILRKKNISKFGTDKLLFDVVKEFESMGLVDAARHLKYPFTFTTPTPSNKDFTHAANLRLDYAFLSKNVLKSLKKIKILKNKITNEASDHYPLIIKLSKQ